MAWNTIGETFRNLLGGTAEDQTDAGISRRELLGGLGLAGVLMVAGPALLSADKAEAEVIKAQYRRRGGHHGHGHRYNRGDLRHQCRNRGFRHRNEHLCRQARRRHGRRGSCVSVGPVAICD